MLSLGEGLGDTVEAVTKTLSLDRVAKRVAELLGYEDCGCDERKDELNKKFPYKKDETIT